MIQRLTLTLSALLIGCSALLADIPFRLHRYDSFKAAPVTSESIIFYGNSITNMNEWWECFGSDPRILNRGNSGGYTQELIDNVESLIAGRPAKVFVGIGTNDLGTAGIDNAEYVAGNIRTLIERFQAESPATEVYIQSILPSNNGLRNNDKTRATNARIRQVCDSLGVTYIDLFDSMLGINDRTISYDDLHLTAKGYKIWCDIIAPYVGVECSYPATFNENSSSLNGSWGMRSTSWSVQEVKPEDVLIIGDEMIHGGEWHELLGIDIKNRGTSWGYGGMSLDQWRTSIKAILDENSSRKNAPRAIVLYMGLNEVNGSTAIADIITSYKAVINRIRKSAPADKTEIILLSQIPQHDANHNTGRIVPFNNAIKTMADEMDNVSYLDIYTPLTNGNVADTRYITSRYLYGRGYNKVAQILAPKVGGKAMSDQEFEQHYAMIQARTTLGAALDAVRKYPEGNGPGQYSAEVLAPLKAKVAAISRLLADPNADISALTTLADELESTVSAVKEGINTPPVWTEDNPVCITLMSVRASKYADAPASVVKGVDKSDATAAAWRVISRGDGSYDLQNAVTGKFVSPSATNNTQLRMTSHQPTRGWQFSYADTPGRYIIISNTTQFNQTNSGLGFAVYNWGNGTTRNDEGCQYIIAETEDPTAGIETAQINIAPAGIYDLMGRRHGIAEAIRPGMYIIDGRKTMIR